MKKIIIRPEGPAKKIILLLFCLKKYLGPDRKSKPPPLHIKWTVPKAFTRRSFTAVKNYQNLLGTCIFRLDCITGQGSSATTIRHRKVFLTVHDPFINSGARSLYCVLPVSSIRHCPTLPFRLAYLYNLFGICNHRRCMFIIFVTKRKLYI